MSLVTQPVLISGPIVLKTELRVAPPTPFTYLPRPHRSPICFSHSVHPPAPSNPFSYLPRPHRSHICPSHSVHPPAPPTPFTHLPAHSVHQSSPPNPFTICPAHSVHNLPRQLRSQNAPPTLFSCTDQNCDTVKVVPFREVKLATCLICIALMGSRDSSVSVVTRLQAEQQRDHSIPGR